MSCGVGYEKIGDYCVKLPKISPWGDEPFVLRFYKTGSDHGIEITVTLDQKGSKVSFKAKPLNIEAGSKK